MNIRFLISFFLLLSLQGFGQGNNTVLLKFEKKGVKDSLRLNYKPNIFFDKLFLINTERQEDSTVVDLMALFPSENNGSVNKKMMCKQDSISLSFIGLMKKYEKANITFDTLWISNFKIESFTIGAVVPLEKKSSNHLDYNRIFNKNLIPKAQIQTLFGHNTKEIIVQQIIVKDESGNLWKIHSRKIKIVNPKS